MKTEPRGGAEEGEHGDDGREQQQDRDEGRRPQAFRVPLAWQAMAFAAASLAAVVASQPRMESLGGAANPL